MMINSFIRIIPVLLLLHFGLPENTHAQFIHSQMEIETELSAVVVQNLSFGDVIANSGVTQIEMGNPNMGIFEIRGLRDQQLLVSLDPPSYLSHTGEDIEGQIPLSIEASYNNSGEINELNYAQPFQENQYTRFTLGGTNGEGNMSAWALAFVYIYGSIEVGEVPEGTYEGTLVFTVEYQ
jgi:hypothetical protein